MISKTSAGLETGSIRDDIGPGGDWAHDSRIDSDLRKSFMEDGFVHMTGLFSADEIAKYNEMAAIERSHVPHGLDAHGFGDRIGQLHQKHESLADFAAHPKIRAFLNWAFGDEAVLFGSLNFERGTQQEAHIDAIFFYPNPIYSMAGVWIALEDAHPDAGPLFYLPGSHCWGLQHSDDIVAAHEELRAPRDMARSDGGTPEARAQAVSDLAAAWTKDLLAKEKELGTERKRMPIKAGDVVVWHSLLAHGGSPTINPALSRRSVVFHYIGKQTKLYTYEQFFLWGRADLSLQNAQELNLRRHGDLRVMKYPYFVTYQDGEQLVHNL